VIKVFLRLRSPKLARHEQAYLLRIARTAIEAKVNKLPVPDFDSSEVPRLSEKHGAFVTLTKDKNLRGCIGMVKGAKPLHQIVRDMAQAAATQDPRFQPLKRDELDELNIEISVLSKLQKVASAKNVKVRKHGVLIKQGDKQGLLLPQVAKKNQWDRKHLLEHACLKAGLSKNAWTEDETEIFVFDAQVFEE
jgi:AmmeMemoRadiSam system protein A